MRNPENNNRDLAALANEDVCEAAVRDARLRNGLTCSSCGSNEHYWLESKSSFQCKKCRFRTSLKSGTLMQGSKMPVSYWVRSVYFIKFYPRLSAYELQSLLGHKFYEPIWNIKKKLKSQLSNHDLQIDSRKSMNTLLNTIGDILSRSSNQ